MEHGESALLNSKQSVSVSSHHLLLLIVNPIFRDYNSLLADEEREVLKD